jgi:hypothetical protein
VALRGSSARVEESHRRQAGEGVEAGVEVDVDVQGTRAELVAVPAVLEGGWRRLALAMQLQGRKKMTSVACGQLRAVADGSERRPKFGWCSRLPRRSPTGGGWRGSARCYSMAELNGEASRGKETASRYEESW